MDQHYNDAKKEQLWWKANQEKWQIY